MKHTKSSLTFYLLLFSVSIFLPKTLKPNDNEKTKASFNQCIESPTPELKTRTDFLKLMPKNGIVAEIGVWDGQFAEKILKYCNPEKLYLIDCWQNQSETVYPDGLNIHFNNKYLEKLHQSVVRKFAHDPRVTVIKAFSPQATDLFENDFFDWVYIDGNHKYEAVSKDLPAWYEKVKTGGVISGHDYVIMSYFGVVPAVNEFLFNNNLELLYLTVEQVPSYAFAKK
ncbi:class I SAM-dependent methyltransferase [Candidatus Dependentiae bacterium]